MNNKSNFFVVYPRNCQSAVQKVMQDLCSDLGVGFELWSYSDVYNESEYYQDVIVPSIEDADFVVVFLYKNSESDYILRESVHLCHNMNKSVVPVKFGYVDVNEKNWSFRSKIIDVCDKKQVADLKDQMRGWLGLVNYFSHEWVDLCLPSGIMWATCNIGAITPIENGEYYVYGAVKPDSEFVADSYPYSNNYGVLPAEADVAFEEWGTGWRMPTRQDFDELVSICRWVWNNDGYMVTGSNGNSIFLPAAGYWLNGRTKLKGVGAYWSGSACEDRLLHAWRLLITPTAYKVNAFNMDCRFSVRPVFVPKK